MYLTSVNFVPGFRFRATTAETLHVEELHFLREYKYKFVGNIVFS